MRCPKTCHLCPASPPTSPCPSSHPGQAQLCPFHRTLASAQRTYPRLSESQVDMEIASSSWLLATPPGETPASRTCSGGCRGSLQCGNQCAASACAHHKVKPRGTEESGSLQGLPEGGPVVLFELMGGGGFCQGVWLSGRKERADPCMQPAHICVDKRDLYLQGGGVRRGGRT